MRYSNLHTHTSFSDGKADMDAFIREAQEKNMLSIGFSDHSYTPCDLTYCMKKGSSAGAITFHQRVSPRSAA